MSLKRTTVWSCDVCLDKETIEKEPCKHQPECRHCGVALTATWTEVK